jgi:hypothetical protein
VPRFYFHLHNDIETFDKEGRDLWGVEAARQAALEEARSMAAESVKLGHLDPSHYVAVTDENGDTLFCTSFGEAVKIVV